MILAFCEFLYVDTDKVRGMQAQLDGGLAEEEHQTSKNGRRAGVGECSPGEVATDTLGTAAAQAGTHAGRLPGEAGDHTGPGVSPAV